MATNVITVGRSGISKRIAGVRRRERKKRRKKKGAEQGNYGEEKITFQVDEEHYNFDTFDACNIDVNDH